MIDLEILTDDDEIKTICELYWEIDSDFEFVYKVAEVAELTSVKKSGLPSMVRENCNASVSGWRCNNCGNPYIFPNRSDLMSKRRYLDESFPYEFDFECDDCRRKRRQAEQEELRKQREAERKAQEEAERMLREQIKKTYDLSKRPIIDVDQLSLRNIVYLTSILRGGAYENLTKIMPLALFERPLAPTKDFAVDIAKQLYRSNLIHIHPDTEPDAFADGKIDTFYVSYVYYAPPICKKDPDDPATILRELYAKINGEWPDEWYQEAYTLWKKVALEECIEYLLFVLDEHHFEFNPGKKTTQYLEYALDYFSTAQVFNIIWRSAKDAAAYYQRERISMRQAANSAIASIQRQTERAIAEGWDIKPFSRNFKCPQSVISQVLYDTVLRVGENGYRLPPKIESIKQGGSLEKDKSKYTIYHSQDLIEKWGYNPDIVARCQRIVYQLSANALLTSVTGRSANASLTFVASRLVNGHNNCVI